MWYTGKIDWRRIEQGFYASTYHQIQIQIQIQKLFIAM